MVRNRLVVGLKDQALSECLQMDSELTLKKAVDLARSSDRSLDPLEVGLNHVTGVVITHHIQEQNALLKNRTV